MKVLVVICLSLFLNLNVYSQEVPQKDAFQEMLNELGIDESNLGYEPKGYWSRYPVPNDIPYVITSFNDLMAEPHRTYDFVRNIALSAETHLSDEYHEKNSNGLLKLAFYSGVQHISTQHRCYNASLYAEIDSTKPLLNAIKEIHKYTGSEWVFNRFGQAADFPLVEKKYQDELDKIDFKIRLAIAPTIHHLLNAVKFRNIALRNVDMKKAQKVWRIRLLGETQFDGMEYYPEMEDCANDIDMNSIIYASYKLMETSDILVKELQRLQSETPELFKEQNLNIMTPIGRIIISGSEKHVHLFNDVLLHVDLGGDDKYIGATGATQSLEQGVSLTIDLSGNDKYVNDDEYLPAQGAAVFGAAMLYDVTGNDIYQSKRLSQGAGMFGVGILYDYDGNDKYDMWTSGQGAAYFGIGLAVDNKGDDSYKFWGDGQGYGGVGGAGTLVNRSGNDTYWAEYDARKLNRMDRDHSKDGQHNYTYCQGSGVGRRGDITDGHSWAGGIGTIIDIEGNDVYTSGNWSQGCGYWYGMGYLWDGSGNDKYESTSWSMACGAHFALSGLFDEGGDDEFKIWYEQGVGMGFGHDYTITFFLNKGGNDKYILQENGFGYSINMSQVYFFDTEGDDRYTTGSKGHNYGWNNFTKNNPPAVSSLYMLYSDQIALFGDLSGNDKYISIDMEDGDESDDERISNNAQIFYPTKEELKDLSNKRFYGLGKDFDNTETSWVIEYFRNKMNK